MTITPADMRAFAASFRHQGCAEAYFLHAAADRIEALEAENERLQGHLNVTNWEFSKVNRDDTELRLARAVVEAARVYFRESPEFFEGLAVKWFRQQAAVRDAIAAYDAHTSNVAEDKLVSATPIKRGHSCDIPGCVQCANPEDKP